MEPLLVGIDIGGTAIKAGLLDREGNLYSAAEIPTPMERRPEDMALVISQLVQNLLKQAALPPEHPVLLGIGVPGMVDGSTVYGATNLGWDEVNFVSVLSRCCPQPVKLINDADAALLGEVYFGAAKGLAHVFMLTLGTGLGGGIYLNGKLYSGNRGFGGELGHIVLMPKGRKCSCGRQGCAEMYLSATALVKETIGELHRYPDSILQSFAKLNTKLIFDNAAADSCCSLVTRRYIERLSRLCLDIANAFRPQAILLGGGVSLAGDILTKPLEEALETGCFSAAQAPKVRVLAASLGNQAGFMGAGAQWLF